MTTFLSLLSFTHTLSHTLSCTHTLLTPFLFFLPSSLPTRTFNLIPQGLLQELHLPPTLGDAAARLHGEEACVEALRRRGLVLVALAGSIQRAVAVYVAL